MCNHGVYLQRQQRSWIQKLIGIKEVYVCSKCGYVLKLR
ncbi:hypothetical protein B6K85_16060 [Vibrio sp. V1B]|jgi:rubrerythrin|nr:hypothetical protein B6K85_16060 [Vibrio sp. V1B]